MLFMVIGITIPVNCIFVPIPVEYSTGDEQLSKKSALLLLAILFFKKLSCCSDSAWQRESGVNH